MADKGGHRGKEIGKELGKEKGKEKEKERRTNEIKIKSRGGGKQKKE